MNITYPHFKDIHSQLCRLCSGICSQGNKYSNKSKTRYNIGGIPKMDLDVRRVRWNHFKGSDAGSSRREDAY